MNKILHLVSCLLLLMSLMAAKAQNVRFLRGNKDISSSFVNSIGHDSDGMVWICTNNGLNRYDGAKNIVLYSENDNNSNVSSFFEDSKKRRFVCASEHVMLYDANKNKLVEIPSFQSDGKEINFSSYGVMEMHDGTILTYTAGHGVYRLEEKNGGLRFVSDDKIITQQYVKFMMEDKRHRLWAATEEGLVCFNGRKLQKVVCDENTTFVSFASVVEDMEGRIWCGSESDGLWSVDAGKMRMSRVSETKGWRVTCLLAEHKEHMLLGTDGNGVYEMNTRTRQLKSFDFNMGMYKSSNAHVHAMHNDTEKNLWIACYQKGVAILPRLENRFGYIGCNSPSANVIGNGCVQSVTVDGTGTLWVAVDGDGLYALKVPYTPTSSSVVHFSPSASMPKTVMALYPDKKGKLWIGSWLQGLYVMDIATRQCKKVELPGTGSVANVFSFVEDGYGHLWIATSGNGLFRMDTATGNIQSVKTPGENKTAGDTENMLHNRWMNQLFMGNDGIMYIATTDGVCGIDVNTLNCLRAFDGKNHILSGMNVNTVCQTSDGMLYIGSSKGLSCYNRKTKEIKTFRHEDGIDGNSVVAIVDDRHGSLWVSTNMGVTRIELKTQKCFNFSSARSMFGNEFSRNAAYVAKDGNIYLGGTEGVTIFKPSQVIESDERPRLLVTGFYIGGNLVNTETLSGGSTVIDTDIIHAKEIELDYSDNSFSIELSSLNFGLTETVQYEYRIDGGNWLIMPVSQNTISFTNMDSGKYKVEIRAKSAGSYSDVRTLIIKIRAPWYNTWWAWLLYLTLIATACAVAVIQLKKRRQAFEMEMNLKRLEEISEAKMQFFINISHEIRTPMTLIVAPLQRLIQSDMDPQRRSAYLLMNRNAQRIIQLVTQLLDVRKIDKGQMQLNFRELDVVKYIDNSAMSFADLFDTKNIKVSFTSTVESLTAWIDPLNFDKILANLLSNAFKYTPKDGAVTVECSVAEDYWQVVVSDTGKGITLEDKEHVFDRFYQNRCDTNNTVQGSGVGLNLTRSLVQMHHGTIEVDNNGDKPGCHFTMRFPLGKAHLSEEELLESETEKVEQKSNTQENKGIIPMTEDKKLLGAKKPMLIVEDDEEIQAYLTAELSSAFNITCVNNGEEAISAIRKKLPAVIISDVMMPVMDGITMLKKIRHNTTMNNIPVILLTAKTSEQDNIEGLDVGADAYITKPFNIEILRRTALNLVKRQIQLKNIYDGRQTPKVDKVEIVSPDEKLMQRIMKVINDNLSNPDLGNNLITQEVGISRVHLYRKLKEMTNLSLREFIRNIRLTEAARLLSENHHSIAEVAEKTGFENVSYFTVVFKQKYGMPPSAYMNKESEK